MESQQGNILIYKRVGNKRSFILMTDQGAQEIKSSDKQLKTTNPWLVNLMELIEEPDFDTLALSPKPKKINMQIPCAKLGYDFSGNIRSMEFQSPEHLQNLLL